MKSFRHSEDGNVTQYQFPHFFLHIVTDYRPLFLLRRWNFEGESRNREKRAHMSYKSSPLFAFFQIVKSSPVDQNASFHIGILCIRILSMYKNSFILCTRVTSDHEIREWKRYRYYILKRLLHSIISSPSKTATPKGEGFVLQLE